MLEGPFVMQVKGGNPVTLRAGQTFYEGPTTFTFVGRNASSTQPAKFRVFLVKHKGAPVRVPVQNSTSCRTLNSLVRRGDLGRDAYNLVLRIIVT
ncbi:MAG: hypothetical protein ACJ74Z_12535 [Bryobacteraceae bacterium]